MNAKLTVLHPFTGSLHVNLINRHSNCYVNIAHFPIMFFLQMYRYTGKKDMLFYPWDFPGKNTDVVCRFLLQGIFDPGIEPLSPAYPA